MRFGIIAPLNWSLSLIGALILIAGIYDLTQNKSENRCEMTYMFEMPSYVPVLKSQNGKYSLFLYEEASKRKNVPYRIPVLFIPGNAGSYKQVRSLASVSLRMAIDKEYTFEYDFYSVDFNEEYSALYGGFLQDQMDFVMSSLEWLETSYSVGALLVGHSIGGLIGRSVLSHNNYTLLRHPVPLLLTLATPHRPIFLADPRMDLFYRRLPYIDPKVSYVNVGGGERDSQVRSGLAHFKDADVNVILSSSPGIWVSADHRCIVWCKQLIIALNRALSEIVNKGRVKNRDAISESFAYHLQKRHYFFKSSKTAMEYRARTLKLSPHSWNTQEKFNFAPNGKLSESKLLLFRPLGSTFDTLYVETFNLRGNWIFACRGESEEDPCLNPDNLYESVQVLPGKRRCVAHLPMIPDLYTHYAISLQKGSENPRVKAEFYDSFTSNLIVKMSKVEEILGLSPLVLVDETKPSKGFYNITFPELHSFWSAYEVEIIPLLDDGDEKRNLGSMHFVNPWSGEVTHATISGNDSTSLSAKLLSLPPTPKPSYMLIYLNAETTTFRITVQMDWMRSFGQTLRFHFPTLIPLFISVALFVIGGQCRVYEEEKTFPSLWSPKAFNPLANIFYLALAFGLLTLGLKMEGVVLNSHFLEHPLLYGFLLWVSSGAFLLLSFLAWVMVVIGGNALSKSLSGLTRLPEFIYDVILEDYFWRFSPFFIPILGSMIFVTCGSFVIALGLLLHVLRLFKMYEAYLTELAWESNGPTRLSDYTLKLNSLNFSLSLTLLWAFSLLLNAPVLLTWIRNDFQSLAFDPSLLSALILIATSFKSLKDSPINPNRQGYGYLGIIFYISGIINIIFFVFKVYRLNYTLNFVIFALNLHQALAPELYTE